MDIDLMAGLLKPKLAASELTTFDNPELPEDAQPDFGALLSAIHSKETPLKGAAAFPAEHIEPPLLKPQDLQLDTAAASETPEAHPVLPLQASMQIGQHPIGNAPDPSTGSETELPNLKIADSNRIPNQTLAEGRPAITDIASKSSDLAKPIAQTSPQAAFAAAAPTSLTTAVDQEPTVASEIRSGNGISGADTPPARAVNASVMAPVQLPIRDTLPKSDVRIHEIPQQEPRFEALKTVVKPMVKVVAQNPVIVQSTPVAAQIDTAEGTADELQFNIKIERQIADVTSVARPASQAPAVAQQISVQLPQILTKADSQRVELRLDPPELGRVTIHLATNDQQVVAQVTAERVDTLDLMRRHAELLSETLARAGFSEANLSFEQGQNSDNPKGEENEAFQLTNGPVEGDTFITSAQVGTAVSGRLDIRL